MTKSDAEKVLLEAELAIMSVDYDLQRWQEELEQAWYATRLDMMIDNIMAPYPSKEWVDLTYYTGLGTRVVIGSAKVGPDGRVDMVISEKDDPLGLVKMSPKEMQASFSIGFDHATREVVTTPNPAAQKLASGIIPDWNDPPSIMDQGVSWYKKFRGEHNGD